MFRNKSRPARFFRTALAAVCFAFVAVVFGAYVRLSEAELGCPTGPACAARAQAPLAARQATAERTPAKRAWKDMVARYIAGALGLLLIRLAVLGWQLRRRPNQQVLIPALTLLLVFGLTAIGVATVDFQYKPIVMMTQIMGGLLVLALLWWIVLREQRLFRSVTASTLTRRLRPRAIFALLLGVLAIVLGGWSMVNYAVLACPDFPTCQGEYWPSADFVEGLTLWREVGIEYEADSLGLPAATAIHYAHRVGALLALLYPGWLALHLLRVGHEENLCRYGLLLLVMLSFATALGVMAAVGGLPLRTAVGHSAAAALFLMSLITLYHVVRPRPTERK